MISVWYQYENPIFNLRSRLKDDLNLQVRNRVHQYKLYVSTPSQYFATFFFTNNSIRICERSIAATYFCLGFDELVLLPGVANVFVYHKLPVDSSYLKYSILALRALSFDPMLLLIALNSSSLQLNISWSYMARFNDVGSLINWAARDPENLALFRFPGYPLPSMRIAFLNSVETFPFLNRGVFTSCTYMKAHSHNIDLCTKISMRVILEPWIWGQYRWWNVFRSSFSWRKDHLLCFYWLLLLIISKY